MGDGIEPSRNEPRPKHNRLCQPNPTRCRVIYFHLYSLCKCGLIKNTVENQ
uniref:Uncharacterized protein n=1 Tax=Meloidogyne enterolobii TaxID=390850 RepID=A0A6V7UHU7_MELEN|nr:unnamed protein product [Meloidogyne enterolobii]